MKLLKTEGHIDPRPGDIAKHDSGPVGRVEGWVVTGYWFWRSVKWQLRVSNAVVMLVDEDKLTLVERPVKAGDRVRYLNLKTQSYEELTVSMIRLMDVAENPGLYSHLEEEWN